METICSLLNTPACMSIIGFRFVCWKMHYIHIIPIPTYRNIASDRISQCNWAHLTLHFPGEECWALFSQTDEFQLTQIDEMFAGGSTQHYLACMSTGCRTFKSWLWLIYSMFSRFDPLNLIYSIPSVFQVIGFNCIVYTNLRDISDSNWRLTNHSFNQFSRSLSIPLLCGSAIVSMSHIISTYMH